MSSFSTAASSIRLHAASDVTSVAKNLKSFSEFVARIASAAPPLPESVVAYLTVNLSHPLPATHILQQAHQLYEASMAVSPFLNTIVVPAIVEKDDVGESERPRTFLAKDLQAFVTEEYKLFDHVALGGTFDRLHPGHKMLLTQAALVATSRVRVGVTGPFLLKNKKNAEMLQPFELRRANAESFLRTLRSDLTLDVVELTERSGGTNAIPDVSAMVVSPETLPSLEAINAERREKGMKDMAAVPIRFVGGDDNESRLSSSKLREIELKKAAREPKGDLKSA